MTQLPWFADLLPVISILLLALVKVGFLIWVFVRTQKISAISYAVYVVLAGFGNFLVPVLLFQSATADNVRLFHIMRSVYGSFSALVETVLFIWLVRSLLRSPRPDPLS
ncbi:MAG: hypothetical protein AAGC93_06065 [Cyanobacteria bacterium P01_F01_bin.53]